MAGARSWHFVAPGRLVFGAGSALRVGEEVRRLGASSATVITGGRRTAERAEALVRELKAAGVRVRIVDGVPPEPAVEDVERVRSSLAWGDGPQAVVAVGGGSVLDTAKLAAALAHRPEPLQRFYGVDEVPEPGIPVVAIPTTAGTGSEVNGVAVVMDRQRQQKCGVVSPHLLPRVALVDPDMLDGQPPEIAAVTGVDALSHALEAYLSVNATPLSDQLALAAVRALARHLRGVVWRGDARSREAVALGSTLAGMAFGQAGVGAAHALAYPLAGRFPMAHGLTVAAFLPEVVEYNLPAQADKVPDLMAALGEAPATGMAARIALGQWLRDLLADLGIPDLWKREGVSVDAATVDAMAAEAVGITRIMRNNPRPVPPSRARELYLRAFERLGTPVWSSRAQAVSG